MTTVTPSEVAEDWDDLPDPDAPVDDRGFIGPLTISAHVDVEAGRVRPSYGADNDTRIVETCRKFFEKFGYAFGAWYLEAEAASVQRSDGLPFRFHEILKLQNKDGRNLGKNMTHAELAAVYLELGVSASYINAGSGSRTTDQPESAIGRMFRFASKTFGKKPYEKTVQLCPAEIFPEGYVYDGEVRIITPKNADEGAPANGNASTLSEDEVIEVVREILAGKMPTEMLDAILDEDRLNGVTTIFGVPIIEAATDESLATVLQENRCMAINGNGALVAL